jgi:hypothetical protein
MSWPGHNGLLDRQYGLMASVDDSGGELARRVQDLESENAHLRGLLGMDRTSRAGAIHPYSPTLFADIATQADPDVTLQRRHHRDQGLCIQWRCVANTNGERGC